MTFPHPHWQLISCQFPPIILCWRGLIPLRSPLKPYDSPKLLHSAPVSSWLKREFLNHVSSLRCFFHQVKKKKKEKAKKEINRRKGNSTDEVLCWYPIDKHFSKRRDTCNSWSPLSCVLSLIIDSPFWYRFFFLNLTEWTLGEFSRTG